MIDVQRAPYSKRLFAFLADVILAGIITAGLYFLLSAAFNVDSYTNRYKEIIAGYERDYGVSFKTTAEEYAKMTEDEKENYKNAVDAANNDKDANDAIVTSYTLSFIIFASGIVLSTVILDFMIPIFTKDGRSLGKLLFGLGVMRRGCTKISTPVLFVRNVIGKGVFEAALPAVIILTVFNNVTGIFGVILLVIFLIAEIFSLIKSGGSSMLHDVLADTVVIDWASQRIFKTVAERDEFIKESEKQAAEFDPYNDSKGNDDSSENI